MFSDKTYYNYTWKSSIKYVFTRISKNGSET